MISRLATNDSHPLLAPSSLILPWHIPVPLSRSPFPPPTLTTVDISFSDGSQYNDNRTVHAKNYSSISFPIYFISNLFHFHSVPVHFMTVIWIAIKWKWHGMKWSDWKWNLMHFGTFCTSHFYISSDIHEFIIYFLMYVVELEMVSSSKGDCYPI